MKKRMYVVTNLDGDKIYSGNLKSALEVIKIEVAENDDEALLGVEFTLTIVFMTDAEIAALSE